MEFTQDYVDAFNHAMIYEVGAFWNPSDPDVIVGNTETRDQRRKVGYVNIPADRGGETKYGIAQNANPNVKVYTIDLEEAMGVYYNSYWLRGRCDKLTPAIALIHFDGCVNHGTGRASKFLQRAVGVVEDGQIGPGTIGAVLEADPQQVIENLSQIRTQFYKAIAEKNPSQKIFLNGWLRRIDEVTAFTLDALQ